MADNQSTFLGLATPVDWGDGAAIAALCIAVVAAEFARRSISSARAAQREATAKAAYLDYLKLALAHPEFSGGLKEELLGAPPSGVSKVDYLAASKEKYDWYVSYMLNSLEEIIFNVEEKNAWRDTIKTQIGYHFEYFSKNKWFLENYRKHYAEEVCCLVDEVCGIKPRSRCNKAHQ